MATMFAKQTRRPVEAVIEEWEAELTPSRELYQTVLQLRAALHKSEERYKTMAEKGALDLWGVLSEVRDKEAQLETQRKWLATMVAITAQSNAKVEKLEDEIVDLKLRVDELEEENKRLDESLTFWQSPNL